MGDHLEDENTGETNKKKVLIKIRRKFEKKSEEIFTKKS